MVTEGQLLNASSFGRRTKTKGVLTTEEAKQFFNRSISAISSLKHRVFFFTDDYCLGVGIPEMNRCGFVPSSTGIPHHIVARDEFPDGMIWSVEDYIRLYYKDYRQLNTIEELLELLNQ